MYFKEKHCRNYSGLKKLPTMPSIFLVEKYDIYIVFIGNNVEFYYNAKTALGWNSNQS